MDSLTNNQKSKAHARCLSLIREKIGHSTTHLEDLIASSANDTKSSAGDKFETSREMLQQEINKAQAHLSQLQGQLQQLNSLGPTQMSLSVELGSYVITDLGSFYISTALGKIKTESGFFYAISVASPMAVALLNELVGATVIVNKRKVTIVRVL